MLTPASLSPPQNPCPVPDSGTQVLPHWTACSTDSCIVIEWLHCQKTLCAELKFIPRWLLPIGLNFALQEMIEWMKSSFYISGLQILLYLYSFLGFSFPSPSNIARVASFQPFSHPACSIWHAVQLVHVQLKCVTPYSRCGTGITSIEFLQSRHPIGSSTPLESVSMNYLRTLVGKQCCTDGTKDY